MGKNDTLFKDQDSQKTDPIGGGTYLSVQYIGVGAPPPGTTPLGKGLDWQSLFEK